MRAPRASNGTNPAPLKAGAIREKMRAVSHTTSQPPPPPPPSRLPSAYTYGASWFPPASGTRGGDVPGFQALRFEDGLMLLSDAQVAKLGGLFGVKGTSLPRLAATASRNALRYLMTQGARRIDDAVAPEAEPCAWNMMLTRRCNQRFSRHSPCCVFASQVSRRQSDQILSTTKYCHKL